ncbi:MAG: acyl-CoA dehydrogenase [Pseudomonadota bacterium]|nr:acyl-CoA dehydrogenase [Pseudomonadota bacterium]
MKDELQLKTRDVEFLLYEVFNVDELVKNERYSHHDRETFAAVLELARDFAEQKFYPLAKPLDHNEPYLKDNKVVTIPELKNILDEYRELGFQKMSAEIALGGMQLPFVVAQAAGAFLAAANVSAIAYSFLTTAAANLLSKYGTISLKNRFLGPMIEGLFFGTMNLSEPQAGSSLADIKVVAKPTKSEHYLISGTKMWISGGEHELSENIVHMVLARLEGAPSGIAGISLFLVPKYREDSEGNFTKQNDIQVVGLNHKMGWHGTTNTVLNYGENSDCHGYLIGEPNKGLLYMFHMMNEARIGVGMHATALGYTGYLHSLSYAKERIQGRRLGAPKSESNQVSIIEHPDIKRLLMMQKLAVEGSLALTLFCALLYDRYLVETNESSKEEINLLLELLTPVAKSWPSEFCLEANKHAIQVLGGYGYTKDFPLERFYRDNRLNPIHEGTHGIQALDLIGRKIFINEGKSFIYLLTLIKETISKAKKDAELKIFGDQLEASIMHLESVVESIKLKRKNSSDYLALSSAGIFLDAFGLILIGWMWLKQGIIVFDKLRVEDTNSFYLGKKSTIKFYFNHDLPKARERLDFISRFDSSFVEMESDWF